MNVCQMTEKEFMVQGGIAILLLGGISLFFPRLVISFYTKFYCLLGREVNIDNVFWCPLAFRLYGLITMILGGIFIKL
jgi:hypothetical protein